MGSESTTKFRNKEIKKEFLRDKNIVNLLAAEGTTKEEIKKVIDEDTLKYDAAICPMINKFKEYILPILQKLNLSYYYSTFGDFGNYIFSSDGNLYMNINALDVIGSEDDIIRTGIYKQIFEKIKHNRNEKENYLGYIQDKVQTFICEGEETNENYDINIFNYSGE